MEATKWVQRYYGVGVILIFHFVKLAASTDICISSEHDWLVHSQAGFDFNIFQVFRCFLILCVGSGVHPFTPILL